VYSSNLCAQVLLVSALDAAGDERILLPRFSFGVNSNLSNLGPLFDDRVHGEAQ